MRPCTLFAVIAAFMCLHCAPTHAQGGLLDLGDTLYGVDDLLDVLADFGCGG